MNSGEIAELTLSAKEQLFEAVRNQFMETMKLPAEFSETSQGINDMGYSVLRTGHDLNEYCEAVSGKAVFENRKTEITEMVSDLCERSKEHFRRKNIALVLKSQNENLFVKIDREKFYYAVLNVFLNAAENTPEGGKVRVVLSKTKKFLKITVSDNGTGMDEETLGHCFEPFFTKGGRFGKRKMGLGLTLAHYFFFESGGRISVASEKGKGTTVSMLIPFMDKEEENLSAESPVPDIFGGKFSPVSIMLSGIGKE